MFDASRVSYRFTNYDYFINEVCWIYTVCNSLIDRFSACVSTFGAAASYLMVLQLFMTAVDQLQLLVVAPGRESTGFRSQSFCFLCG